jgi:hypothetical protein
VYAWRLGNTWSLCCQIWYITDNVLCLPHYHACWQKSDLVTLSKVYQLSIYHNKSEDCAVLCECVFRCIYDHRCMRVVLYVVVHIFAIPSRSFVISQLWLVHRRHISVLFIPSPETSAFIDTNTYIGTMFSTIDWPTDGDWETDNNWYSLWWNLL